MRKIILIVLFSIMLNGCKNNYTKFEYIENIKEIENLINNENRIIIEITKKDCYYCEKLNKEEKN